MKILHLPVDTGGQAWGLSRAERNLGADSTNIVFQKSRFSYNCDRSLELDRYSIFKRYFLRTKYLFKFLKKYDIFHFYFGVTFWPFNLDLFVLKLFKKKLFFTFQGSDIRFKKYKIENKVIFNNYISWYKFDFIKKCKIKFINLFADKTYVLNPDLLLSSPNSEYLPYANVNIDKIKPDNILAKRYNIVHSPSNRKIKGTDIIIKIIRSLKVNEFPKINLILNENISHDQVIKNSKVAQLAVDQLKIGWYGGYAVEMMALGIPVICYINKKILYHLKLKDLYNIPIISANASNLKEVLSYYLDNEDKLKEISKKSRKFAESHHNPKKIAKYTLTAYNNAFK